MEDIQKYYKNTENAMPNPMLVKFIELNVKPKNAIDLGCGAGRDTVYLIKNGWTVLAIDKENTEDIIDNRLSDDEKVNFRFSCQNFENIEIEENNLVVSNFSLPFCNKDKFYKLWESIKDSILVGRILRWKLFW